MGVFLLDGLKFYYDCDELSGTRADSGPNGLDVPVTGSVGSVSGALGQGVGGTGNTSNYLEAAHDDLFRVPGAFTLSYWTFIPTGTLTSNHPAIGHFNTTSPNEEAGWLGYMRNSNDRHTFEVSADGVPANVVLPRSHERGPIEASQGQANHSSTFSYFNHAKKLRSRVLTSIPSPGQAA